MAISNASVFSEKHDRRSIIRYCLVACEDCDAHKSAVIVCGAAWKRFVQLHRGVWGARRVRRRDAERALKALRALSRRHGRAGRRQRQPRPTALAARQPAGEGPAETRDQFHRAQQGARQAERMEKANSRHGVFPEGEDPAAAGSGGRQPEHGARAAERADRRATQGMCHVYTVRSVMQLHTKSPMSYSRLVKN